MAGVLSRPRDVHHHRPSNLLSPWQAFELVRAGRDLADLWDLPIGGTRVL
ncbi:hypothetical protein [Actinomycetospora sp. NBC_00405]